MPVCTQVACASTLALHAWVSRCTAHRSLPPPSRSKRTRSCRAWAQSSLLAQGRAQAGAVPYLQLPSRLFRSRRRPSPPTLPESPRWASLPSCLPSIPPSSWSLPPPHLHPSHARVLTLSVASRLCYCDDTTRCSGPHCYDNCHADCSACRRGTNHGSCPFVEAAGVFRRAPCWI